MQRDQKEMQINLKSSLKAQLVGVNFGFCLFFVVPINYIFTLQMSVAL